MLADQHSLVVRKVPNVGVGPLWIQVHAAQNQSQGILIRQLFAFIRDPAKMPCFIGSPELLGPQERIYIVVLRLRAAETRSSGECWLEDAQVVALLVRRCIAGDAGAWEDIVQRYHRRIYNICYRFAGSADDAQDLTQEVFIKIYRTLNSYDLGRGAFMTWVTSITRNLLVDHFRKSKQDRLTDSLDAGASEHEEAQPLSEQIQDKAAPPDASVQHRETRETVHRALQKLSPELREAVVLRDLQDMDYREIATVLKVPEGTVKSRINRGRTELARLLQRTYRQVM